ELLKAQLESEGALVKTATNGKQAIEMAQQSRPDVILMDIIMPVVNGIEATRILKQTENLSSIPVIAVTASIDHTTLGEARQAGCFASAYKPINPSEIVELILSATRFRVD
ncbi:MAG: response regulator, partial [Gammaproteobacteria bacterium]|nr:response regulator [Gammaproteobacteria bacterium]